MLQRDQYGSLRDSKDASEQRLINEARKLISLLDSPDEHGAWERGCDFDAKGRGSAVNVDLYGVARWRRRVYAVVQIRRDGADASTPVTAAMAWVWGVTERQLSTIARNGDVALLPEKPARGAEDVSVGRDAVRVIDSHVVEASEARTDGSTVWVRNARLSHLKGQHPSAEVVGWARVLVGQRARTWGFSRPTAD